MTGPHESDLAVSTSTMNEWALMIATSVWTQQAKNLAAAATSLRSIGKDMAEGFGPGTQTAVSAQDAFATVAANTETRAGQMTQVVTALNTASDGMRAAQIEHRSLVNSPAPSQPTAPTYDPDADEYDQIKKQMIYGNQQTAYNNAMADRETRAQVALRTMDTAYAEATGAMKEVHGDPDAPDPTPPTPPQGGGGGGSPSTPTNPQQPTTNNHHVEQVPHVVEVVHPVRPPTVVVVGPVHEVGPHVTQQPVSTPMHPVSHPTGYPTSYPGSHPTAPVVGSAQGADAGATAVATPSSGGAGGHAGVSGSGGSGGALGAVGGALGGRLGAGAVAGGSVRGALSAAQVKAIGAGGSRGQGGVLGKSSTAGGTTARGTGAGRGAGGAKSGAGSRGAGGRGAAGKGGAAGGKGGRGGAGGASKGKGKDKRSRTEIEFFDTEKDWVDDEGVAPGVLE